ncbi:MAG TPA: arginine--tRNA ligase [Epsilonproteobacteria bacterium]|nr:arginine--tRNA ligase [Campylobacterota bacterium]
MKLKAHIGTIIHEAFNRLDISLSSEIQVVPASRVEFGDFQYNGVMKLAKSMGKNPKELALLLASQIDTSGAIAKVEVAGPGFVNIWLNDSWLDGAIGNLFENRFDNFANSLNPETIVVDYSGPNMAKEMHVGHLRSTIIGDSLANLFEFLGHKVIRQNHIGDWGTQFGMLIAYLEEQDSAAYAKLKDLEEFYKLAKTRFDSDTKFANKARDYVVKIQSKDKHCLGLWEKFISISLAHSQEVYDKLGVLLTPKDVRAESFYNDMLPEIISHLEQKNLLTVSDGAKCVFLPEEETPVIVQKRDGGYLYATTDLAALFYRYKTLKADRICYVVDARQSEHFKQVFKVAKLASFVGDETVLEHIAFGTMMDKNGKPFKTRDGGTIKLIELLDEAVSRAKDAIKSKENLKPDELEKLAQTIGIGAVKYADLSVNREANYIFDWDKMLSFEGNTSLYLQYAYARIQSIFSKTQIELNKDKLAIQNELEHRLSILLLSFKEVLLHAAKEATPHTITSYLYDLATLFMQFYESCPILKEGVSPKEQNTRLILAQITADTIAQGLKILGIGVVQRL